jgi:hypothetical protein
MHFQPSTSWNVDASMLSLRGAAHSLSLSLFPEHLDVNTFPSSYIRDGIRLCIGSSSPDSETGGTGCHLRSWPSIRSKDWYKPSRSSRARECSSGSQPVGQKRRSRCSKQRESHLPGGTPLYGSARKQGAPFGIATGGSLPRVLRNKRFQRWPLLET